MLCRLRLPSPLRTGFGTVILRLVASIWLLVGMGVYGQELSVPGIKAPDEKRSSSNQELPVEIRAALGLAPLGKLYDYLKVEPSKIQSLPAPDAREMRLSAKPDAKRVRIGTVRAFQRPLRVSTDAVLYRVPEGEVSVMGVRSEGALYTRVRFSRMSLPAGARVFVYSLENPNEFYGPYENRGPSKDGTFWTPPIEGDAVGIEYFNPNLGNDFNDNPFQVSEISHVFRDPLAKATANSAAGECNLEVTGDWAEVAKSVGRLQFTSGGGEYLCTGTLLNNQANDLTPYLLTANHCFNTQAEAQTLRVHWNYNTGDSPPTGTPRTDGSTLLSTRADSDYTFVRLTGALPAGLFFSGWEISATPVSTAITGIHHPRGSHKRISFGATIAHNTIGLPGPSQNFTAVRWNPNAGVTEQGSSGSGIWKGTPSNARLVGTLTGGEASCETPAGIDYYGSFNVTYPNIALYLTGSSSGGNCPATPIYTGQTINGALATSDCRQQHQGNSFTDLYSFNGVAGQRVSIAMTAAFDTYLYLIGPNGAVVAFNDDSGGTVNSRIPVNSGLFTLPATGAYTIEATSYNPSVTGSYTLVFGGPVSSLQLSAAAVGEGNGRVTASVVRSGDISSAATVDYSTSDTAGLAQCKPDPPSGIASARCDYAASVGTLRFAAGESSKTIQIPIVDDAFAEGTENFTLTLRNPIGVNLGSISSTALTITDNESVTANSNPIDATPFFVRQHYMDFLGREPEQAGFAGWQNILNNCGITVAQPCDRIEVSSAFYRSEEFQTRGYFIYRFFSTSFARLPRYNEFLTDFAKVSGFLSKEQLEANKVAFVTEFMSRQEFRSKYDSKTAPADYVNALVTTAGVTLPNKQALIDDLTAKRKTRAQVLRAVAESVEVYNKYYTEAFVVMQYFGYLRRDPDILYKEWIKTMNAYNGDYRIMVNGFMNSKEYRDRFGP